MSASFRKLLSWRVAIGGPWVVKTGLYGYEKPSSSPSVDMALYRSSMNIGAALCLPWRCGRGRCGNPRIDRISRCISRRSWLFKRRWMKLEWTSLSRVKFVKTVSARTQYPQTSDRTRAHKSSNETMMNFRAEFHTNVNEPIQTGDEWNVNAGLISYFAPTFRPLENTLGFINALVTCCVRFKPILETLNL